MVKSQWEIPKNQIQSSHGFKIQQRFHQVWSGFTIYPSGAWSSNVATFFSET